MLKDKARCYGYKSTRNTENRARVEKTKLSKDWYYKRNKRTMSFIYFIWKTNVKDIQNKISLIIINLYYIFIYKSGVELSHILFMIVYVQITLINN